MSLLHSAKLNGHDPTPTCATCWTACLRNRPAGSPSCCRIAGHPALDFLWTGDAAVKMTSPRAYVPIAMVRCGCECLAAADADCRQQRQKEFVRRPHFRHQDGSHRDDCLIGRPRSGLCASSGMTAGLASPAPDVREGGRAQVSNFHEAWVELPPARKRIGISAFGNRQGCLGLLNKPEISTLRRADARLRLT
jgi:hypothetical protein